MSEPKKIEEIKDFKTGTNETGVLESNALLNKAIVLAAALVTK